MRAIGLALDFDGVLYDSLPALERTYNQFLATFGASGSDKEFVQLNGPTISEIVRILRNEHNLPGPIDALHELYLSLLNANYSNCRLAPDVKEVVERISAKQIPLFLVTSSVRSSVLRILDGFNLLKYFNFIITGDDVRSSKPSPEPYARLIDQFPHLEIWAVEDSENGLQSARTAGCKTVFLDAKRCGTSTVVDTRIFELSELPSRIQQIQDGCFLVDRGGRVVLTHGDNLVKPQILTDAAQQRQELSAEYSSDQMSRTTSCYLGHTSDTDTLTVSHKLVSRNLAAVHAARPDSALSKFIALAVSGVCLDESGRVLVGRRRNVTEYEGLLELVPSGGLEIDATFAEGGNAVTQVLREFTEETTVDASAVVECEFIGLALDSGHLVMDMLFKLQIHRSAVSMPRDTEEYSELTWREPSSLRGQGLTPTSHVLLNLLYLERSSSSSLGSFC